MRRISSRKNPWIGPNNLRGGNEVRNDKKKNGVVIPKTASAKQYSETVEKHDEWMITHFNINGK